MPAFDGTLKPEEIKAVSIFVFSHARRWSLRLSTSGMRQSVIPAHGFQSLLARLGANGPIGPPPAALPSPAGLTRL